MKKSKRRYDNLTLILAGGVAAALVGAGAASAWVWLRQRPAESARAHRKRATRFTTWAFGAAGAVGAAIGAALLGPRVAKPSLRALEHAAGRVADGDWARMLGRFSSVAEEASRAAHKYSRHLH